MADAPNPDGLIASRLEHLFRTVHPADRRPYTPGDVAAAINREAGEDVISGQYIWLLRTGRRDNPTYKHLIAISRFFGVSPMYFFDESETDRGAIPPEVAVVLQDDAVRDLALRAAGLSERSLKAISDMVDSARSLQAEPSSRRSRQTDEGQQRATALARQADGELPAYLPGDEDLGHASSETATGADLAELGPNQ